MEYSKSPSYKVYAPERIPSAGSITIAAATAVTAAVTFLSTRFIEHEIAVLSIFIPRFAVSNVTAHGDMFILPYSCAEPESLVIVRKCSHLRIFNQIIV